VSHAEQVGRGFGLTQPQKLTEGIVRGDLADLMNAAANDAQKLIYANMSKGTFSGKTRASQLTAATKGLGSLSADIWNEVHALTRQGIHGASQLALNQQLDRDFLSGMPFNAIKQYQEAMYFNAFQSAEDIISRRTNGFTLQQRIYKGGRAGVVQAAKEVETGLLLQLSAKELADRVHDLYNPNVPGGQSYAASRLARTEINNAHHDTTIRHAETTPWVYGYKWHLSGSHPRPDICNEYAEADHDGLGPGVFKKGNAPSKPHPHCLCYLTVMQPDRDEFLDSLANGRYDDHLESLGTRC
jgi:hypothetical protein